MNYSDIAHKKGEEVVYWFASPGQPIKAYVDDAKFSHTSSSYELYALQLYIDSRIKMREWYLQHDSSHTTTSTSSCQ